MSLLPSGIDDNDPMILSENLQGNIILDKLRYQIENESFCDVVIFVEHTKFSLHRNVLASFSPYFERLFVANKTTRERFDITNHRADTFRHFANYIYTGSLVIHKNNVFELFKLSDKLEVGKLKMCCAEYLERRLSLSNCLDVKKLAEKLNVPNLIEPTLSFIKANINSILGQNLFINLDVFDLNALFRDMTLVLSPMQVIAVALDWVRYDVQKRERQLWSIVKHIKCGELDSQYLNEIIESNDLFINSEMSLFFLLKHYTNNGFSFERYAVLLNELTIKYSNCLVTEKPPEIDDRIYKVDPVVKKKKAKRFLRGNPIARLAALRSALLLRRQVNRKKHAMKKGKSYNLANELKEPKTLKCHLCSHFAGDTTSLEHHLSSVHSRDVTYKCGVCGFVCQWNNLYLEHISGHFPGPPYKCDSCDFSSDKLNEIMTHRSEHAEEKTLKCLQCSFRCRSQSNLQAHAKCHVPSYEKNANSNERRGYVCDVCGFSTKFLSHLVAHKRIHSSDLYRCSYPHCKFTTGKKNQLGSHAKSHQGVRPHCCQICGRGFLEKSHLVRHERIHLEEKPFKCGECDYASSRRDKLKEHQARHHGDHASAKIPYKPRPNKKSSQSYPESYSPVENSGRGHHGSHSSSTSGEVPDVLAQHHNLPLVNTNAYPIFSSTEAHHAANSSAFHQQQLLNSSGRGKDHRSVHHSTAAAVTAAMMLDPRFHHGGSGGSPYGTPISGVVSQSAGQPSHQVPDYPAALMSLF